LKNSISLQFLSKVVNTHNGILPLFSKIVRFNESTNNSSINLISPSLPIKDSANNHTKKTEKEKHYDQNQALLHFQYDRSWFIGVEGNEYSSLIISDINYHSFLDIQKQQQTLVQLSHLNLISLDARLLHYESFATDLSIDNFTESSVRRNHCFSNNSNSNYSSNTRGDDDKDTDYNQNKKSNKKRHRKHIGACWSLAVCRGMSSALSTRVSRYPSSSYGYTSHFRRAIAFMVSLFLTNFHPFCI
jgi:hypothetical protein